MADESKKDQQMKNQNGRSVLVISAEDIKEAASASQATSDWLGYLTTATKVVEKNNFSWGILHSKNTPGFNIENLKKKLKCILIIQKQIECFREINILVLQI